MEARTRSGSLSIRNVGKVYNPGGAKVVALEDISVEIRAGSFCVFVGPSGCGKTTLLNTVAGFDTVTAGEIYLDNVLLSAPEHAPQPGSDRIVVFQNGSLFPWKTVLWNAVCGPVQQGRMKYAEAAAHARELLARVGLKGIEAQYPGELSGGMKRRVEIVRALINEPKILLLDEPFRALDALTKSVVQEYLLELYDLVPRTVFFITHDVEEAVFLADTVIVMTTRPGRILKILNVDMERPRTHRILTSERFLAIENEIRAAIHDEARKAFEAGERELAA
jgi:ABC-type nitrate/sulfonate/bicarbonate transport system ATPase subunit